MTCGNKNILQIADEIDRIYDTALTNKMVAALQPKDIDKLRFRFFFAWFDFWIGAYYDVGHRTLYVCPLPMCVLRFEFTGQKDESKHRQDRITTTEATITVEEALAELREMFPTSTWTEVSYYHDDKVGVINRIEVAGEVFEGRPLSDCMAQVRAWKQENRG